MKEHPILFSAPMVRAILEGRKTMTRRVVKPKHLLLLENIVDGFLDGKWNQRPMPYGQPGDRLWVRETWAETDRHDGTPVVAYRAGGNIAIGRDVAHGTDRLIPAYAWNDTVEVDRWRPSIHMPRWASRITLEITSVCVERLHDIPLASIISEGVEVPIDPESGNVLLDVSTKHGPSHFLTKEQLGDLGAVLLAHWAALWVAINGIDSWNANPWVWVIEFKQVTQ